MQQIPATTSALDVAKASAAENSAPGASMSSLLSHVRIWPVARSIPLLMAFACPSSGLDSRKIRGHKQYEDKERAKLELKPGASRHVGLPLGNPFQHSRDIPSIWSSAIATRRLRQEVLERLLPIAVIDPDSCFGAFACSI